MLLLRREFVAALDGGPAAGPSGRQQTAFRAAGECLDAHRRQHVVGGAQLFARLDAPAFAPQPLAVEQMGAREVGPDPGAAEPFERLAIQAVCRLALAQQRAATRLRSERPFSCTGAGGLRELLEGAGRPVRLPAALSRLDQLDEPPVRRRGALLPVR